MNKTTGSQRQVRRCVHLLREPDSEIETEPRDWKRVTTSVTSAKAQICHPTHVDEKMLVNIYKTKKYALAIDAPSHNAGPCL